MAQANRKKNVSSAAPVPKVVAATLGSAVATLLIWIVSLATGTEIPVPVVGAVTTLATFGFGYLKSP